MTGPEKALWQRLRQAQLGVSFRRQHPIGAYIVDFAAPSIKLAIELDGMQHGFEKETLRDAQRSLVLEREGWTVIRFWNSELTENYEGIVETIWIKVQSRVSTQCAL